MVLAGSVAASNAALKVGSVFCDANTNGIIDTGDFPVGGLLVVVTNTSGTFSNASLTTAHGSFVVELPDTNDTYIDFILATTLPAGTLAVLPPFGTFSIDTNNLVVTNDFLIQDVACVAPPPPQTNGPCWVSGGGTIRTGHHGKPAHSFGGVVNPGCRTNAAHGGSWNDIDHVNRLHFRAIQTEVVTCGNVPGYPAGSHGPHTPFNYIDFQGVGKLSGMGGNHTNFGFVQFYARCEDHGHPGRGNDRYYLRVTDGLGNVLMLVSGDQVDPMDIAPVPISSGNLQLHVSGCGQ